MAAWQIWIDTGGTFTDCLAIDPAKRLHRLKVLSSGLLRGSFVKRLTNSTLQVALQWPTTTDIYAGYRIRIGASWESKIVSAEPATGLIVAEDPLPGLLLQQVVEIDTGEEVPVFAARLVTLTYLKSDFPSIEMKLGSTRGTNAILERKGARTALLITKGFKDLLVIGTQQRPDLFALHVEKPPVYYECVFEVDERIGADGTVLQSLTEESVQNLIDVLSTSRVESIAVALLNSYRNPAHEQLLSKRLAQTGFKYISTSSALSNQIKILPRAETTVANAYLSPVIDTYVSRIRSGLKYARLHVMSSYGGLIDAAAFHPKDSLLSGPAGGVAGAAVKGKQSGINRLIAFDMGGTSTDVSLYDNRFDYRYESKVGSLKILSPSLAIETIAAGGGSICKADATSLSVGPESAGADPGPACYGKGGPLTLTDVNLLLGRIDAEHFSIPLSTDAATKAFNDFCRSAKVGTGQRARTQVLLSLVRIANEKMAAAIGRVSTQLGHRPADFALLSFGGAGGQHACAVAEILSMSKILVPYDAGLLSAFGIGHARVQRFKEELVLQPLAGSIHHISQRFEKLQASAIKELVNEGHPREEIAVHERLVFLRFNGQESSLELKITQRSPDERELLRLFKARYRKIFGHWVTDQYVEIESIRISVEAGQRSVIPRARKARRYNPSKDHVRAMITSSGSLKSRIYRWENLQAGASIIGPALVVSNNSSTVVSPGWEFYLDANNNALLTRKSKASDRGAYSASATLELFINRFTSIAQQMGAMLQRTSFSVNVKERLDFSCALLDNEGYLVVNAPHIPVHLGSLGICVREVLKKIRPKEGEVIITNHPAFGGSHLPDITLIMPVHYQGRLVGYIANRAHHAEIGGTRPGSMPSDATTLEEEGVIIEPRIFAKRGKVDWQPIARLFKQSKYPTRAWAENQADLNGALASIRFGDELLRDLCKKYGPRIVSAQMKKLRSHAATIFNSRLKKLPARRYKATERLDDGSVLSVDISRSSRGLIFDFHGSSSTHQGNLNATTAIVQSVVLYVIRILVDHPVPMNEGLMQNVKLILPTGILNPDFLSQPVPAVVGGNTEVSQRLTDTLLKAFGLAACSQGTMNNFLFGNDKLGYYETICGGTGAGRGFHGTSAVHQHMTNTRITDPEILEARYPVSLQRFEIRERSGGDGQWRGGNGVIREFLFRKELDISLLTQHRLERPYGMAGGLAGGVGRQRITRSDGVTEEIGGTASAKVFPGDRLVIETPGGGGYGLPPKK